MRKYTKQEQAEAILNRELTAQEQSLFDQIAETATRIVDNYTHKQYIDIEGVAPSAETRYYDGGNGPELFIDDFTTLSAVVILDSAGDVYDTLTTDQYVFTPANDTIKNSIRLRRGQGYNYFRDGVQNVKVTGVFHSGSVPSDVQIVTARIVAHYYNNFSIEQSIKKSEHIEGYSYTLLTSSDQQSRLENILSDLGGRKKILI